LSIEKATEKKLMNSRELKTEAHLDRLAVLALCPERSAEAVRHVAALDQAGCERFIRLAETHHVVIRALGPLLHRAGTEGHRGLAKLLGAAISREQERIGGALSGLERVCTELEAAGCSVVVMKTLDHWPDFGSDLDLVTTGDAKRGILADIPSMCPHLKSASWPRHSSACTGISTYASAILRIPRS
jgi:hypothetical protein